MTNPERRLLWSGDAEADLLSIWRYGADEWSPTSADEHLRDIEQACHLLLDAPELGRSRDELLLGVRSIPLDPHIIFYRISLKTVEIIRVLHQREVIDSIFP